MMTTFKIKNLFLISILISFFACGDKTNAPVKALEKPYYDVKGFFDGETKRLTEGGMKIKKTVTVNGKSETKIIEKPNFEEEFKLFVASDINRPAWSDKYHVNEKPSGNHDFTREYDDDSEDFLYNGSRNSEGPGSASNYRSSFLHEKETLAFR